MNAEQENLRQTIFDFIADSMCEADEEAWERHLQTYDELLAEVKQLRRVIHDVVVDLTVTNIGGPDGQRAAHIAAMNTLSEVIDVD
jgi:hypothetical protein